MKSLLKSKKDLKLFQNTFFSGRRDLEALHEAICKDCGKGAHGLFRCAEKRFSKSRQRWVDCKYSCWLIYFQSLLQKLSCTIYFDWLLQRLSGNIYFQWLLQKLSCTGSPLIVGFWGPEKTLQMEICTIRGVLTV